MTRDHVIPTSYLREKRRFSGDWLVPACRDCNSLIGDELIFNVPDRAAWVAAILRRKFRRLLQSRQWSDDEIAELGTSLRSAVILDREKRKETARRLEHLDIVAKMDSTYLSSGRPWIAVEDEVAIEFLDDDDQAARERRATLLARANKRYKSTGYDR